MKSLTQAALKAARRFGDNESVLSTREGFKTTITNTLKSAVISTLSSLEKPLLTGWEEHVDTDRSSKPSAFSLHGTGSSGSIDTLTDKAAAKAYSEYRSELSKDAPTKDIHSAIAKMYSSLSKEYLPEQNQTVTPLSSHGIGSSGSIDTLTDKAAAEAYDQYRIESNKPLSVTDILNMRREQLAREEAQEAANKKKPVTIEAIIDARRSELRQEESAAQMNKLINIRREVLAKEAFSTLPPTTHVGETSKDGTTVAPAPKGKGIGEG